MFASLKYTRWKLYKYFDIDGDKATLTIYWCHKYPLLHLYMLIRVEDYTKHLTLTKVGGCSSPQTLLKLSKFLFLVFKERQT